MTNEGDDDCLEKNRRNSRHTVWENRPNELDPAEMSAEKIEGRKYTNGLKALFIHLIPPLGVNYGFPERLFFNDRSMKNDCTRFHLWKFLIN
jgi:hypothetical protein